MNDEASLTKVLRMVAVASRTGIYGGPFDTARRQAEIASSIGLKCTLTGGHFLNDEPLDGLFSHTEHYYLVTRSNKTHKFSLVCSTQAILGLYREVKNHDIVHVSFAREILPLSTTVFALLLRRQLILQPHGMLTSRSSFLHKLTDIPVRALFSRAKKVVALTEKERSALIQWAPRHKGAIVILGNPVPDNVFPKKRALSSKPKISFIARLHPRKRVDIFIEAARKLTNEFPTRFVAFGPDGGDQSIAEMASSTIPNFSYEGAISSSQVTEELDSTDIFVLPSSNEPWGNVLATSLRLGVPVVVSRSTALASTIEDYGAGLLFDDGDSDALADCIRLLINNRELYSRSSEGALELGRNLLSREKQQRDLLTLYTF